MSRLHATPTQMRSHDILGEAVATIATQRRRLVLTVCGLALAVAAFVAIPGLASTATGQIASAFDQRLPTHVRITTTQRGQPQVAAPFPADVERRLGALHGVIAVGTYWRLTLSNPTVLFARPTSGLASPPPGEAGTGRAAHQPHGIGPPGIGPPGIGPQESGPQESGPQESGPQESGPQESGPQESGPALFAATPGFLTAAGAQVSQGRLFGSWDQARAEPVCLLGVQAARRLAVTSVGHQAAIMINGLPCTVIGIIAHVSSQPWILQSVLMPSSAAIALWNSPPGHPGARPGALVKTRLGAARLIAGQAPFAIDPLDPARYAVTTAPSPARLRGQVAGDLAGMYAALAWISLLAGAVGIGIVMTFAIAERTAEIGLRRALGARRRHIAAQILAESAILGLLGGLIGASAGVVTVAAIAIAAGWVPVIAPGTALSAPLIGAAIGLISSLYPALRAARAEPANALSAR